MADSGPPWASTTLDNLSYTEQEGWKKLDTDVTVTSDTDDFSNGYVEVNIIDANSYDELRLVSGGSLSVSGDAVYWGGDRIGTINNAYDGSNGRLRIDFSSVSPLMNANFETGDLNGWTVNDSYTGVTGQAWVESPADDPDVTYVDSDPTYDDHCYSVCSYGVITQSAIVQSSIVNEQSYALQLTIGGTVLEGYGTAHGPMVTSSGFTAEAGDNISLTWNAVAGGDWYDVYGFLFKDADNDGDWDDSENYQKLFHDVGVNTGGWITTNATLSSDVSGENIRFVFLNGNYDASGGRAIGSSLYIDGITVYITNITVANDSIMVSIIENIEYDNTNDDPSTMKIYNLNFKESDGGTGFNAAHINITAVNDPPNAPSSPQCEGQTNPTAVSDFTPEFGWTFFDPESGDVQGAYQIIVGTSEGSDNMWNSSKVASSSSSDISYAGSALAPGTTYHWKVKTWDNLDAEGSYCADQTFMTTGPTLTLGSISTIINDWGRNFNLNHSVAVADANATNVNVTYNASWITSCTLGDVNITETEWCNQTVSNSTVQQITIRVNATSTTGSATNDSETLLLNITKRDINIISNPVVTQNVNVDTTFWINSSVQGEYSENFNSTAVLLREGIVIGTPQAITDGNANFSTTESLAGTFNFSIRFYNLTHYNNASTSNSSVTINGPTLTLSNVSDVTQDWGRNFNLNHSVTVINATATNVDVTYNVTWLTEYTLGTVNKDATGWSNQTFSNSTVQQITVRVNANSTNTSAVNDTDTFQVNITNRDINIVSNPAATQTVNPDTILWINATAQGEYTENFIGSAVLLREGIVIGTPQAITDGNANFSTTEPLAGTFNFSIRFYNLTHYNNASTSNSSVTINVPTLTLSNVSDITQDWGRNFNLNHSVTVTSAAATNVNVNYNISWLTEYTLGTMNKDATGWSNQTFSNSTVQQITARVNANSTNTSAVNDTETFKINITNRDISIASNPAATQTVNPDTTLWINATAQGEYTENFIGSAVLLREGIVIGTPRAITDGNANFSTTEPLAGTFNFSIRFYNLTHYNNESTSNSSVTIDGPTLTLGNVLDITRDWGRNFDLDHSVTVTNATATNVDVTYNIPWLTDCTMGTVNKDATKWCNQTVSNSIVQQITVRVNANSTNTSAVNDTKTFKLDITNRDINIISNPVATQTVNPDTTFWINATAQGEYAENFIGNAVLLREGIVIGTPQVITDGNANFSTTEPLAGTFNFLIRFYNPTYYNDASTSASSVTINGPTLTLTNVSDVTRDWGQNFNLNHSVTVINATATNVNVTYNVTWLTECTLGTVNKDATKWCNRTFSNSTVQQITVRVNANSTNTFVANDTDTFQVNITNRDINIVSNPAATQTVNPDTILWINATAQGEYAENFIGSAVLVREGIVIGTPQTITDQNANFSTTEPLAGTFNFSIRFYNLTHYKNASTSNSSVTVNGPTLTLSNVSDVTQDWGRNFNLNHSVTVINATATNVNVNYNISWLEDCTLGTVNKDATKWCNQTVSNSTVQQITGMLNANSTNTSAVNDTKTFKLDITKRDININSNPAASQTVYLDTTFWINATARGEYNETFTGIAVLVREGIVVDIPQTVIDGNASFNSTESSAGTYEYSIRFYNLTSYNNASTDNSMLTVKTPAYPDADGSGISGVGISDEPENIDESIFLKLFLNSGTTTVYHFNTVINSVEVTSKGSYGLVSAKVEVLKEKPGSISDDLPNGVIYKYINIYLGPSNWADDKMSDMTINFQVPASWCNENNIDPASVVMYRYHDDEWQPLETTMNGLVSGFYQYSSPTPGFSTFIILEHVRDSRSMIDSTAVRKTTGSESAATRETPGFGLLLGIMGILIAVYFIFKKKIQ